MNEDLISAVQSRFKAQFQTEPLLIFSPGRINLIGEHTDYNDGFVFPAAIDKGIALAIQKSPDSTSTLVALDKNESYVFEVEHLQPLPQGSWQNYILGVVAEIPALGKNMAPFQAVFSGNIPGGAGMSSSAALENSVVFGLDELYKLGLSKRDMIFISQRAEHHYVGVKCGIMDQFASMFGVADSALLLDCRSLESKSFHIQFGDYELLLINTNVKHDLSESAYNDRRAVCEAVSQRLGIKALRDASLDDLNALRHELSSADFEKASYVIEENTRVQRFASAITEEDLPTLGKLLYQSHEGLSEKYQVSCPELDFLVMEAKKSSDVLGARMMGGGFGGCTINLVKKSGIDQFKAAVSKAYLQQFGWACSIYDVTLSEGTHRIENQD